MYVSHEHLIYRSGLDYFVHDYDGHRSGPFTLSEAQTHRDSFVAAHQSSNEPIYIA